MSLNPRLRTHQRDSRIGVDLIHSSQGEAVMSEPFWLTDQQMRRIERYFPLLHGVPRVDDRRVISGIIFVIKNGLRWRDAPADYGPH